MFNNERKIIKKITKKVKIDSFLDSILKKMDFYLNLHDVEITTNNNMIIIENENGTISIEIEPTGIIYKENSNNEMITKEYIETKNGYVVKLKEEEETVFDLKNKYSINKSKREVVRVYDKEGIEQFRRKTKKYDNYYKDKKTGEITLSEPDLMENYIQNDYNFRLEDKYIVKRSILKYAYPDGTESFINLQNRDECYLRYENITEDCKEIPDWGSYYGIDKEVFFNYKQNKATTNDIVNNFYSKKYHIPHTIYI